MKYKLLTILVIFLINLPLGATNYYVSPTGGDSNGGLSVGDAWLSLDNGNQTGILVPGDTVLILGGTYTPSASYLFDIDGTAALPIVYRAYNHIPAQIDLGGQAFDGVTVEGSYIKVENLEIFNGGNDGVHTLGDSVVIYGCNIHNFALDGINIEGDYNLILRNRIWKTGSNGINNRIGGIYNQFHNNTIYDIAVYGIRLQDGVVTTQMFNNIILKTDTAISAQPSNVIGFNLLWDFTEPYAGGCSDTAGNIQSDPLFYDTASGDFTLRYNSPAINSGLDLGYSFNHSAPERGAVEMYNNYYVSTTGNDDADGLTVATPWTTIDNGDADRKNILIPGDTVNILAGTYLRDTAVYLSTSGAYEQPVVYRAYGNGDVNIDLDNNTSSGAIIVGNYVVLDSLNFVSSLNYGISLTGDSSIVRNCHSHNNNKDGINVTGDGNLILRNVFYNNTESGIEDNSTGPSNLIFNNTCYNNGTYGIYVQLTVPEARVFNNISVANTYGIYGGSDNVFAYNDVWNNTYYNVIYGGSASDSAGGMSVDPLFVDAASGDFSLDELSPVIDQGLNLGYPYAGSAPDMGAFESSTSVLTYVQIELFDGSPVPDSLNTDDDTLVLYCRGYTGYATLLGDYAATWSLIGADSIGTVIPGPAVSTSLTLTTPGTGQIVAEYSPTMIDTTDIMTCQSGFPVDLIVTPVTDTVSADSTLQFTAVSVDADGNPSTPGIMPSWTVLGGIGTINLSGLFTATTAGEGYIVASGLGIADTVGPITVIPGDLAFLEVIPDSTEISADSTLQFEVVGGDADGNINDVGTITWEVIGDIGTIDATGLFTADTAGTGQIAATSSIGGLADTNTIVTVLPGTLVRLVISPDVAAVNINDTVQFSAVGYDADSNLTATGDLTWQVVGRVGDIDSTGLFIADRPGTGLVSSVSSINDVTDTTGTIDVEELYISVVPIGTQTTAPDESNAPVLTFRIDNYYDEDKTVTGFTVRDISRGEGDSAEKLTNADSVNIFLDADEDSLLGGGDVLLATAEHDSYNINLIVPPQIVPADSGRTFIVTMTTSRNPHDGDSLDMYLLSATDVTTEDGTPIAGPDSVNSFGYTVINGMIAAQISLNAAGTTTMEPGDSIYPVLDFTLPRNGYAVDTLNVLTFINTGTAVPDDFDSLMLFKDDGDDVFVDADESCLGKITYTGSRWSISGLTVPLPDETNHFYVGASLSDYPTNGATVVFSIPVGGVEMTSYNDGPLDMAVTVDDTIIIQTSEAVEIIPWTITSQNLIPGEITPALLGFELVNSYVDSVRIDSLHCLFQAVDPEGATQAELDSQVDSLLLYVAVGNAAATFVAGAHLSDGEAVFALDDFSVAGSGGSVNFSIAAALNAQNCKDGNLINIVINDSLEIYFGNPVTMVGEFPIENEDSFPIDAFPAGNITVQNLTELTHFGGQVDRAVFDFTLPGNGYDDGWLSDFSVENLGTLDDAKTITGMYLWADMTGNGLTVDDSPLGTFVNNHGVWRWVGEAHLIPSGGARFYITVNIANESFTAGTLQLSIFREGVVYESGMVGPDDIAVVNPQTHLVFPSNRVTVISFPQVTETILPGASENLVLTFAMYNSYLTQNQNLQALTLSNISHSASSLEFADQELGQVSLFYDKDKNRIYNNDSLIATGYFADGILKMSGLDVILPPESLSYFFVLADLPLNQIDLDSLMVAINSPSDFVFEGAVNVNGDLPLSRGGYLVVDGSVERQYQIRPLSARTLSPGDTSVSLLMFFPAFNGDQMDVLTGLTVNNLEDADDSDISTLELWMDLNGDSLWQDADSLLGTFVYDGSRWSLTGLNVAIDSNPPLLMVLGDISLTATPNVAFRSEIPLNGCQFSSANDGPIDNPLTGSITFPISTSSMRVTYNSLNPTYSVGQDIDLLITVSNILTDSLRGIKSEIVNISDSSRVALQDSVSGPVDLAAGESTGFYYSYSAVGSGSINWQMRATSTDVPDTSVTIQTESTLIQAVPQNVRVNLINNMPTSVTQGQENVFPMSLVISHSDSLSEEAPIRLDSIIMNVESSSGQPLYADDIFSRIVVAGGYDILTILTVIPHQTAVTLVFLSPVIIPADQEMNLTFLMNIDSLATLDDFVLSFTGSASIPVFDNNSLAAVTLDPAIAFPLKTEACRIDVPSHQMMISCTSLLSEFVNIGQFHVPVLNMILRHPEEVGSSQIQLMSFKMIFVDSAENPINAAEVLDRVQVCREQLIIGEVNDLGADTGLVDIQLSMPLALSPGEMDSLIIVVDVKPVVGYAGFGLIIPDSTVFTVRDLSSGSSLTMATDTTRLVAGSVFPITTGWAQLNQAALPLTVCVSSAVPGSTTGGRDSLPLIDISIDYNVPVGVSAVILREISVSVHDSLGMSYDPDRLFDRIGYSLDGIPVAYQSSEYIVGNVVTFRLGSDGLRVNPGEQHDIRLFSDIEADVPYDHFSLSIPFSNNIVLTDATDTSLTPGLVLAAGCAAVFPFITQTAYIYLPAGRPVLETANLPVQNSFPGQGDITLLDWPLTYDSPSLEGEILINELNGRLLQRSSQGLSEVGDNPVFDAVYLMIDDELVAWDSSLSGGVLHLAPVEAYTVARGDSLTLQLKAAIKADAPLGNYVFRFDDSTFLNITDKNLLTQVYAELSNGSYPLYAVEMSLSAPDLGRSFVNYPNPFIPSRGEVTTISYNLSEDAYVDIEIFSITGEAVSEVTLNSLRAQGVHQSDVWAGLNDKGRRVAAGTYFCRITARYVSGREESFRRKIAVIR